jgi:NADP-dependent 3-hydroxy acid dehydrogenase YdfG
MKMEDLTGKVAVVTGASSGIGEAAARLLVAEGVHVILSARRRERIEVLAEELGHKATAVIADVVDVDQVHALFEEIRARFGGLDLLFNNAGLGVFGLFTGSAPEDWRRMIDTNIYGMLNCTRAAIPLMKGRRGAMISSVSSTGGRYGVEGWSHRRRYRTGSGLRVRAASARLGRGDPRATCQAGRPLIEHGTISFLMKPAALNARAAFAAPSTGPFFPRVTRVR